MSAALRAVSVGALLCAVFLPGVAGAQTTTVPSRTCPPPWIMSSWTDYDDVYQVTLVNRRSPFGDCQRTTVGVVALAVPEQTVLYSTVTPLALIGPGGVPTGPPAQVTVTLPALGCGSHNVQIDVVAADGVSLGRKLERVTNAPCPPVTTAAAPLPTTSTVPVATSSPTAAQPAAIGPTEIVRQPRVEPYRTNLMSPTSTPPVTEGVAVESASVTTTSQATRVLGISATAPTATPITTVGALPQPGVNHAGLLAGLSAVVAGAIAVLIGWRRRAGL